MSEAVTRVLVIDDEPAICELVEAVAESIGFHVTSASSADEIEVALGGRFDLVVLDLSLGDLDGIELMGRLGASHRGLPIILVSGADETLITSASRIAEMHRLRVLAKFAKPFSLDLLRTAMSEMRNIGPRVIDPTGPRVLIEEGQLLDPEFLRLVYQPKVSALTGDVIGVEALVRWQHPVKGNVPPSIYVALVEEMNRTADLLDAVMSMAAHDRHRHRALASMPDVSLNISVLDLTDDELPRRAQRILTATAPADAWTFEVTETAPITDMTPAVSVLTRLRLAGFHLAVDDFGTGTSNYERLLVAPFTELKIDRAIINRLVVDATEPDPMAKSGVDVGHSLDMQVVAEGVETLEQFRLVRDLGCDAVQGYFVATPVPPTQIDEALDSWAENFGASGLAPEDF